MDKIKKAISQVKNVIRHILAIFIILLAVAAFSISAFSGILILLSGILCSPCSSKMIRKLTGKKIKGIFIAVLVVILFLAGFAAVPSTDTDLEAEAAMEEAMPDPVQTSAPLLAETPTEKPASMPAEATTATPTKEPTAMPTKAPTEAPTKTPAAAPTATLTPTESPTPAPTKEPTSAPTLEPTAFPTKEPAPVPVTEETKTQENTGTTSTGGSGNSQFGEAVAQNVYIGNRNNHKLHVSTCHTLPKEKNQVIFNSLEEALAAGYDDYCGNCMK